jgi:hypothetical protein
LQTPPQIDIQFNPRYTSPTLWDEEQGHDFRQGWLSLFIIIFSHTLPVGDAAPLLQKGGIVEYGWGWMMDILFPGIGKKGVVGFIRAFLGELNGLA